MANAGYFSGTNSRSTNAAEHDYYATDPRAVEILLENETFNHKIWEPACGEGHISKVLESAGYDVYSSDLIYRGFGDPTPLDFLNETLENFDGDIVTNPPFNVAEKFIRQALASVRDSHKVAMFLRFTFLGGKRRRDLFRSFPPKTMYLFSGRVECGKNGVFENKTGVDYVWVVWEKGFHGDPIIKWVN